MITPSPLHTAAVQCEGCGQRAVIFHNKPIVDPPKGWILFDYRDGTYYCSECSDKYNYDDFPESDAEYFMVIEEPTR